MLKKLSQKVKSDLYLSACFAVLYTATNTLTCIQKILSVSIQVDNPSYAADGYVNLGLGYTFIALAIWFSPAIVFAIGCRRALIASTFSFLLISSFYFESTIITYLSSAVTGAGSAVLWTAQANYIVLNSEVGHVYQGISSFWMIYAVSNVFGNVFLYLQFADSTVSVDRPMRNKIALIFLGFVLLAIIMLFRLKPPLREESSKKNNQRPSATNEIKKAFSIMMEKPVSISCLLSIYIGILTSFRSVLGTCMGFSQYLSTNSKEYVPLAGLIQGLGDTVGCCLSLFLEKSTISKLKPIYTLGVIASVIAYVIAFVSLPDASVFSYTSQLPLIQLPMPVACLLVANALVGVATACLLIEIYQFLGALYPDDSAPTFAVYKFIRSISTGASYFYSNLMGLHMQLIILMVVAVLGQASYFYLLRTVKSTNQEKKPLLDPA